MAENKKISPINLQSNDVATLGAQGNSIIAHNNGLVSIRAAGSNEIEAVDPFTDDASGIYTSPGGIAINAQSVQTNYQTINTQNQSQENLGNIVQPTFSDVTPTPTPTPSSSITPTPTPTITPTPSPDEFEDIIFLPEREDSPIARFSPFVIETIQYSDQEEIGKDGGVPLVEEKFEDINLENFTTLPSRIVNSKNFQKFIGTAGVKAKVESIVKKLGVTFNDLIVIINAESAGTFDPAVRNPTGGAIGLIQFMPSTAKALGTTTDALSKMTILQQLEFVDKYFSFYKGKYKNGVYDLYGVTFFPLLVGKPQNWIIQSKKLSAKVISEQNPAIARAAGKTPGAPLIVADFYKYVNKILK